MVPAEAGPASVKGNADPMIQKVSLWSLTLALLLVLGACQQQQVKPKPVEPMPPVVTPDPDPLPPVVTPEPMSPTQFTLYYPTGSRATSTLALTKTAPARARRGGMIEYNLTVENIGAQTIKNVVVTDYFDPPQAVEIQPSGDITDVGGGQRKWRVGELRPGESRTVTMSGTVVGSVQEIRNCAYAEFVADGCVTTLIDDPSLDIALVCEPQSVVTCDDANLTVTVRNTGTGAARNVVVEGSSPSGATIDGQSSFSRVLGDIPAGGQETFTVKGAGWDQNAMDPTPYRFEFMARENVAGGSQTNTVDCTVEAARPMLDITKVAEKDEQVVNVPVGYTITVTNTGRVPLTDLRVVDQLDPRSKIDSAGGGVVDGNRISWNIGTLGVGDSREFMVRAYSTEVTRDSGRPIVNTATATAYCAETKTATAEVHYKGYNALLLEVLDRADGRDYDPVRIGDETIYVISVTNQGTAVDQNITLEITPDPKQSFGGIVSGPTMTSTDLGGTTAIAPLASLAPGQTQIWKIRVKANEAGFARLTVRVNSDKTSPFQEEEGTTIVE